ncbi:MAG: ABC transporter permease [Actinomycetota bacterium]
MTHTDIDTGSDTAGDREADAGSETTTDRAATVSGTSTDQDVGATSGALERHASGVVKRRLLAGATSALAVPVVAVVAALAVGAVLLVLIDLSPIDVYRDVFDGVFVANRGLTDTATAATPVVLIGLGYSIAYHARVYTIGAEGVYLMGAIAAIGAVTAPGLRDLGTLPLVVLGLVAAALAGLAWSAIAGWLNVRFGASVVISSLMLVYVAQAILQWSNRVGLRDPESFVAASRRVGNAELPDLPFIDVHLGFGIAVLAAPLLWWVRNRTRFGFRTTVLGANPEALDANEIRSGRVIILVLAVAGVLAGLAGFVETAGVTGRLNDSASVGYGFTAIVVALVGRLHPIGVLVAGLALSALDIGFEVAARASDLPSSMAGLIQVLVVVFVVAGDAVLDGIRRRAAGGRS